jgi:NADH:ubiquinone oxidoreductase subunit C
MSIKVRRQSSYLIVYFLKDWSVSELEQLSELLVYELNTFIEPRYIVGYYLLSLSRNYRLKVYSEVCIYNIVYSVTKLFKSANWLEREAWDMFGLIFFGHQDLRNILTDYSFQYHVLQKVYPLVGFVELYYCDDNKLIIQYPVTLLLIKRSFMN